MLGNVVNGFTSIHVDVTTAAVSIVSAGDHGRERTSLDLELQKRHWRAVGLSVRLKKVGRGQRVDNARVKSCKSALLACLPRRRRLGCIERVVSKLAFVGGRQAHERLSHFRLNHGNEAGEGMGENGWLRRVRSNSRIPNEVASVPLCVVSRYDCAFCGVWLSSLLLADLHRGRVLLCREASFCR